MLVVTGAYALQYKAIASNVTTLAYYLPRFSCQDCLLYQKDCHESHSRAGVYELRIGEHQSLNFKSLSADIRACASDKKRVRVQPSSIPTHSNVEQCWEVCRPRQPGSPGYGARIGLPNLRLIRFLHPGHVARPRHSSTSTSSYAHVEERRSHQDHHQQPSRDRSQSQGSERRLLPASALF